jgi:ergothioneine biosynthesis protein EgtB
MSPSVTSPAPGPVPAAPAPLAERLARVRAATTRLCAPLATEDYVVQSMPEASPVKWHLAHTTWFFETFVLGPHQPGFRPHREEWGPLYNSYYVAVGPRHPRGERGLLTRPTVAEVQAWRAWVDERLQAFLATPEGGRPEVAALVELGLQHEQQHQELLLTDLLHAFSRNPLEPAYLEGAPPASVFKPLGWTRRAGGIVRIGHEGQDFAFDNEGPAHRVFLEPFELASRPVGCGEFAEFISDGGYRRAELWLSDGFEAARSGGWEAPLYWSGRDGSWRRFTLHGDQPVDPSAPVAHLSYYEADAYARWAGARLPTEAEWESVAVEQPVEGQFVEGGLLAPVADGGEASLFGGAWCWTASPYVAYPGFRPAAGAIGEYNGKFMVNQLVLRGGSCLSPRDHLRASYRNFFPPGARWQMTGLRLAR